MDIEMGSILKKAPPPFLCRLMKMQSKDATMLLIIHVDRCNVEFQVGRQEIHVQRCPEKYQQHHGACWLFPNIRGMGMYSVKLVDGSERFMAQRPLKKECNCNCFERMSTRRTMTTMMNLTRIVCIVDTVAYGNKVLSQNRSARTQKNHCRKGRHGAMPTLNWRGGGGIYVLYNPSSCLVGLRVAVESGG